MKERLSEPSPRIRWMVANRHASAFCRKPVLFHAVVYIHDHFVDKQELIHRAGLSGLFLRRKVGEIVLHH